MDTDSGIGKTWTLDDTTRASNPGRLKVSAVCWFTHKPVWPTLWAGSLAGAIALALLMHWAWWIAAGLLILFNLIYWVRLKELFRCGCTNPAVVVGERPTLIAVSTDLRMGFGHYPCIKILSVPLRAIGGQPIQIGMRLATVATYVASADPRQRHWDDFDPHPAEFATFNQSEIERVIASISTADWLDLDDGLRQLQQPYQPGLYMVEPRDL